MNPVDTAYSELKSMIDFYVPWEDKMFFSQEPSHKVMVGIIKYVQAIEAERLLLEEIKNLGT